MKFNQIILSLIAEKIRQQPTLEEILQQITAAAQTGVIAFYPCSRCTNQLVKLLQQNSPQMLSRIAGVFDSSPDAFADGGLSVFPLAELPRFQPSLAAVVVTSNVFYGCEVEHLLSVTGTAMPVIPVSGIDLELAVADREGLLAQIHEVYGLLADEKSRVVYLLAWLARLLNDENLTQLFADDKGQEVISVNGTTLFRSYRLDKLPAEIVRELEADVYSLKAVTAASGDTVLDIGAFKGDTAIYFADLVGSTGRVISFEPVRANFLDLVHNVRQNGLEAVVVPVNMGCGRASGRQGIATAPNGSPWAFFSGSQGKEEIEVTTVDEYVAAENLTKVDFIKLDVEGVELDVITGAAKTITGFCPKMAVSLYHNLSDLTVLPLLLNSLTGYKLFIRCKMAGPWSIFLYCEPGA